MKYEVVLEATFRKTVYVEAATSYEAEGIAQEATCFDETWEMNGLDFDAEVYSLKSWPKDATRVFKIDGAVQYLHKEE